MIKIQIYWLKWLKVHESDLHLQSHPCNGLTLGYTKKILRVQVFKTFGFKCVLFFCLPFYNFQTPTNIINYLTT